MEGVQEKLGALEMLNLRAPPAAGHRETQEQIFIRNHGDRVASLR